MRVLKLSIRLKSSRQDNLHSRALQMQEMSPKKESPMLAGAETNFPLITLTTVLQQHCFANTKTYLKQKDKLKAKVD